MRYLFLSLVLGLSLGCTEEGPSKADARLNQGSGPNGEDLCADNGWYEDSVCDDFCLERDPACETDVRSDAAVPDSQTDARVEGDDASTDLFRDGSTDDKIEPKSCKVGGCSSELCQEEPGGFESTCEWKDQYACFRGAICERDADGNCGWRQTDELNACLQGQRQ